MVKKTQDTKSTRMIGLWAIFVFCLVTVSISLVSVVFPALISSSVGYPNTLQELGLSQKINPFEIGIMAAPLFASSIIVLGLAFFYFKNRMPKSLSKFFKKLFRFEVSKKVTVIIIAIVLSAYVVTTLPELQTQEEWNDFIPMEKRLLESIRDDRLTIQDAINGNPNYPVFEPHTKYSLLIISEKVFGNFKVIPFLASIALLLTVYLITKEIAKKRFAGIISMLIVIQSNIFLIYDTSATYDNFWILFYLISLYTVIRAWPISPLSYLISIPAKALTAMFLPMSLFFIYRSNIQRKKKLILLGTYVLIGIIGIVAITSFNVGLPGSETIKSDVEFWQGFSSMAFQLRFDWLVTLFLLPLVVGLFVASRHGYKHAESILVMVGIFLLIEPFLTGFTNMTNQPYRVIPLVIFFAMGVGTLLSKTSSDDE